MNASDWTCKYNRGKHQLEIVYPAEESTLRVYNLYWGFRNSLLFLFVYCAKYKQPASQRLMVLASYKDIEHS